jgi:hypothetical protein
MVSPFPFYDYPSEPHKIAVPVWALLIIKGEIGNPASGLYDPGQGRPLFVSCGIAVKFVAVMLGSAEPTQKNFWRFPVLKFDNWCRFL